MNYKQGDLAYLIPLEEFSEGDQQTITNSPQLSKLLTQPFTVTSVTYRNINGTFEGKDVMFYDSQIRPYLQSEGAELVYSVI